MNNAYLLTGGNLANREANLETAKREIERRAGRIVDASALYETAPWGMEEQPAFLNQVLEVQMLFSPAELLQHLLAIEEIIGRKRDVKFGPRVIDIDVLFYGDEIISTPSLTVPHPEIQNRRFVLVPMNEIAGSFIHPGLKKNIRQLLAECKDPLDVSIFKHRTV